MDFQSLSRRELQSLCKLNKIPANITNIAMIEALKSLEIIEGIEEFLNPAKSETESLVELSEESELKSPRAPRTSCRTSTRQKVKKTEPETLPPTATRTTRGGRRQLTNELDESKNDVLETPAMFSTRRKVLPTSSIRSVESQLNECEEEDNAEELKCITNSPVVVETCSRRKGATVKKQSTAQRVYSTRRSTRLTEKKSAEPFVMEKEITEPIKIDSFLSEVNLSSKEGLCDSIEVSDNKSESGAGIIGTFHDSIRSSTNVDDNVGEGNQKAKLEEICNAFEKLDVLVVKEKVHNLAIETSATASIVESTIENEVKKVDSDELDNLKPESEESTLENKVKKVECDELEGKMNLEEQNEVEGHNVDSVPETSATASIVESTIENEVEKVDSDELDNLKPESEESTLENKVKKVECDELEGKMNLEEQNEVEGHNVDSVPEKQSDNLIYDNAGLVSVLDNAISNEPEMRMVVETQETVDDVMPTIDEEDQDLNPNEKISTVNFADPTVDDVTSTEENNQLSLILNDVIDHPICRTPTSFKKMIRVSDDKENIESGRKLEVVIMDEEKMNKKEKVEDEKLKSLNEISMRQLKKQLKALTLKNMDNHTGAANKVAKPRPALQALCDNQFVASETKN